MKHRVWILPLILLIALLGAGYFRWELVASKSYDSGVYKWELDRWTGQVWFEQYSVNAGMEVEPVISQIDAFEYEKLLQNAPKKRDTFTKWWRIGLGVVSVWFAIAGFIYSPIKERRNAQSGKSGPQSTLN